jgi:Homeodomain-like domain
MKKYHVLLSVSERSELTALTLKQKVSAQAKLRAQILLACDESGYGPAKTDKAITASLPVSKRTIEHLRERAVEVGPVEALGPRPRVRTYERKLDGAGEARLVQLACSKAPDGREKWTLQLLADELVTLAVVDEISDETVRRTLKKTNSSLT